MGPVEMGLVADLLFFPDRLEPVADWLVPEDFSNPWLGTVYATVLDLHRRAERRDLTAVRAELKATGLWEATIAARYGELLGAGTGNPRSAAREVVQAATSRRMAIALADAAESLKEGQAPADVWDTLAATVPEEREWLAAPDDLIDVSDFVSRAETTRGEWVIPGMMRRGWRAIVVGGEGMGKGLLLQQMALCAAAGVHPFGASEDYEPQSVLMVDAENPPERIADGCAPMLAHLRATAPPHRQAVVWHRPGGIDLRSRWGRVSLTRRLEHTRPTLVTMGPLYKLYSKTAKESDEDAAKEVTQYLDDVRTRYNFALVLEHHAPHGFANQRDMRPFGSTVWQRWPDFGIGLMPRKKDSAGNALAEGTMKLARFRGDRMKATWPEFIEYAKPLPWGARYATGTFSDPFPEF